MEITKKIAEELSVKPSQVEAAVKLIDEGCTIPFIARYRKEVTGSLNDEQLRNLDDRLKYLRNLEDRKAQVIASIEEQGKLTEELKAQIDELTMENIKLQQDRYELTNLRELYDLDAQYDDYPKIGARIIAKDSGNWYHSFVIDKGYDNGLSIDMNVMAGSGLVGRITDVGPNWSKVIAIIDDNSNVSGMTLATGDNLIVSGDLQMMAQGVIPFSKLVDSQDAVAEGDKVVTSDISDKYLPNILIGYISTINKDTNNLTKSGYLTPVVDFEHLSEVLVITDKKQQVPGGGADGE